MQMAVTAGLWLLATCIAIPVAVALYKTGKPVRRLLGSGVQGLCAMAAVNIAGAFTGVSIGLNAFTGACALALGIPGIIGVLVLKMIFGV